MISSMFSVWMPAPDGTVAVAVTVAGVDPIDAYERAMRLTGEPIAGARIEPVEPSAGAYPLRRA